MSTEPVLPESAVATTEPQRSELTVRQRQKMEAVGQLAAGLAHEINTPSQFILDNLNFLQDVWSDLMGLFDGTVKPENIDIAYLRQEVPAAISQSVEGIERISKIAKAMRNFSHPGGEREWLNINQAIESTAIISRNEWKYFAELFVDLDLSIPELFIHAAEFKHVLLNLVINAAHAIEARGHHEGDERIDLITRLVGDWVEISVRDTGVGIPEAIRPRIFDPFFTTKPVGKGTGQGLTIAYNVVQQHGGSLDFVSEVGQGTTFTIRLPATRLESTDEHHNANPVC